MSIRHKNSYFNPLTYFVHQTNYVTTFQFHLCFNQWFVPSILAMGTLYAMSRNYFHILAAPIGQFHSFSQDFNWPYLDLWCFKGKTTIWISAFASIFMTVVFKWLGKNEFAIEKISKFQTDSLVYFCSNQGWQKQRSYSELGSTYDGRPKRATWDNLFTLSTLHCYRLFIKALKATSLCLIFFSAFSVTRGKES